MANVTYWGRLRMGDNPNYDFLVAGLEICTNALSQILGVDVGFTTMVMPPTGVTFTRLQFRAPSGDILGVWWWHRLSESFVLIHHILVYMDLQDIYRRLQNVER